ncbi:DMT family transporter [Secundilactobacillus folii]|uniref:QacE family quaternary ammonium compound efflux SMR transporter n=1 Tax=Secundilactobacillus folii TaxID=2678357 RepID=A0A7X2XWW2_9LACO|nr:multidrug efflux SMR transporter [Secundilactobacillus folii]MTV83094.1 QacE family quaternary ammonium compound efflux SMR transporter [Secundilactobacillus folii]
MIKYYFALGVAIVTEIGGTMALKLSDGFTQLFWTLLSIAVFLLMLYSLSFAMRVVPLSVAYGLWSGAGTILTAAMGAVLFHETFSVGQVIGLLLIVVGVVALNGSGAVDEEIDYEGLQVEDKFK